MKNLHLFILFEEIVFQILDFFLVLFGLFCQPLNFNISLRKLLFQFIILEGEIFFPFLIFLIQNKKLLFKMLYSLWQNWNTHHRRRVFNAVIGLDIFRISGRNHFRFSIFKVCLVMRKSFVMFIVHFTNSNIDKNLSWN